MTRFEELQLEAEKRLSEDKYREVARKLINKDKGKHSNVFELPLGFKDTIGYVRFCKYGMV